MEAVGGYKSWVYSSLNILQSTIAENPFTSAVGRDESPLSIGEALTTVPEDKALPGHQRNTSNPFAPNEDSSAWDLEKQHFVSEMALLREQLKSETAQRLESQVGDKVSNVVPKTTVVSWF